MTPITSFQLRFCAAIVGVLKTRLSSAYALEKPWTTEGFPIGESLFHCNEYYLRKQLVAVLSDLATITCELVSALVHIWSATL